VGHGLRPGVLLLLEAVLTVVCPGVLVVAVPLVVLQVAVLLLLVVVLVVLQLPLDVVQLGGPWGQAGRLPCWADPLSAQERPCCCCHPLLGPLTVMMLGHDGAAACEADPGRVQP
jgi:hypothetical protein